MLSTAEIEYLTHTWSPVVAVPDGISGPQPAMFEGVGIDDGCQLCRDNIQHVHEERLRTLPAGEEKRIGLGFGTDLFGSGHYRRADDPQETIPARSVLGTISELVRESGHTFITPTQVPEGIPEDLNPSENWWLMVIVRNQKEAESRIPAALRSPFVHVGVIYEPALGPLDLENLVLEGQDQERLDALRGIGSIGGRPTFCWERRVEWVIAGGMSGEEAAPAHPDWFRRVRDLCQSVGTPFYFTRWGAYAPVDHESSITDYTFSWWFEEGDIFVWPDGHSCPADRKHAMVIGPYEVHMRRVPEVTDARYLDDMMWYEMPADLAPCVGPPSVA